VTEQEWLICRDPEVLLLYLRGRTSDRKFRLFAAACSRRLWPVFGDDTVREVVAMTERYADGLVSERDCSLALTRSYDYLRTLSPYTAPRIAAEATNAALGGAAWAAAWNVVSEARRALRAHGNVDVQSEAWAQADLLRHVTGYPGRAIALGPGWLTSEVVGLARGAYEEQEMPLGTLDRARLAVLSDALEEAGCTSATILEHLRGPGSHPRGCWALDLLLGKA
jgi:hypothetical protein